MTSSKNSVRTAYLSLGVLALAYAFAYADRFLMAILIQPIKVEMGLSDSSIGLLTGFAFFVFYSAAGIPLGRLADRVNRKTLLAASLMAWSVATVGCGMASTFVQLLLTRMAVGIGEGACAPTSHSLISDLFPAGRRALPLAIFTAGGMLGMFGGFAAGGVLESALGWRGAFGILGGAGILMIPLIALMLQEPRTAPSVAHPVATSLRELFATPGYLLLVLSYSFVILGLLGVTQWLPAFYERSFGLSRLSIGGTLSVVGGVGALTGLVIGGWSADQGSCRNPSWPLFQFVGAAALALPLQLAMLLVPSSIVSFGLAFLSMLVGWAGIGPVFAVIQTAVPPGARATATATLLVGSSLVGMGGGPLLVGLLSDVFQTSLHADSLRWALIVVTTIGGMAAVILGIIPIRKLGKTLRVGSLMAGNAYEAAVSESYKI